MADSRPEAGAADGDVEALRIAREEGQRTLDAQLSALDDVDGKALSVFRLDVAVVGALLSALSFAAGSDVAVAGDLVNPITGAGVALFALSAAAAGLAYVAAGQRIGAGPAGLERANGSSERAFLTGLVAGYAEWIRANERTNARKTPLVTLAVLGTVAGSLAVAVGVVGAFTGAVLVPAAGAAAFVVVLGALAGLPGQLRRLFGDRDEVPGAVAPQSLEAPMPGQRVLPDRDRED